MIEYSRQLSEQRRTMLHPFLMAALLVLLMFAYLAGLISSQLWPLVVAAAAGLFCVIESRLAGFSWAHPRILVLGYVILACSTPTVFAFLYPDSEFAEFFQNLFLGKLSPEMPFLMAITILATGVGLSLQSYQPPRISAPPENKFGVDQDPSIVTRHRIGQVVLIASAIPIFLVAVMNGVTGRGVNQIYFGTHNALTNLGQFVVHAAVIVVYSSRLRLRWSFGKETLDHVMLALAICGYLLNGSRNMVLSLVLTLFILKQAIKGTKFRNILVLVLVGAVLFSWIARYRISDPYTQSKPFTVASAWNAFLTDLCSVAGTTGVVHSQVPAVTPFTLGATSWADLVRLLPSPIANALFGQRTNTGAFKFRQVLEYENPNNGVGFSLPAAGYLDFGWFGLIGIMILSGWVLGLLWRRFDPYHGSVLALAYLLVAARFPMFLRAELLGLMKGSLYPLAIIWLIIFLANKGKRREPCQQGISSGSQISSRSEIKPREKLSNTPERNLRKAKR